MSLMSSMSSMCCSSIFSAVDDVSFFLLFLFLSFFSFLRPSSRVQRPRRYYIPFCPLLVDTASLPPRRRRFCLPLTFCLFDALTGQGSGSKKGWGWMEGPTSPSCHRHPLPSHRFSFSCLRLLLFSCSIFILLFFLVLVVILHRFVCSSPPLPVFSNSVRRCRKSELTEPEQRNRHVPSTTVETVRLACPFLFSSVSAPFFF